MSPASSQTSKRILIACPTLGFSVEANTNPQLWLTGLLSVLNQVRALGFDHATIFPYRLQWWPANNVIWDAAFENGFDYILRIDDDVHTIPDNAVKLLIEADKSVVGAAYPNRRFPYMVQAVNRTSPDSLINICLKDKMVLRSAGCPEGEDPVVRVDLIGFGMTLIRVKDFQYMPRPMFQGPENVPDDTYFAQLCLDNSINQYVHFGVQIHHAHVSFTNNGYLYNAAVMAPKHEARPNEVVA